MARKFLTPIDLSKLEIQNVAIQNVASFPTSPAVGQIVFRSDLKKAFVNSGDTDLGDSGWVAVDGANIPDNTITSAKIADDTIVNADIKSDAAIAYTKLNLTGSIVNADVKSDAAIAYSKLSLTGSIVNADVASNAAIAYSKLNLASSLVDADVKSDANISISKLNTSQFDTQVRLSRLDQMAAPTASVGLNSQKITGLADPTSDTDAANKRYVDGAVQGLSWKTAVRVSSATDVDLLAPGATIDGITMSSGDRVLLIGQTAPEENGIYVWSGASAALTRSADANSAAELQGAAVFVMEGTRADQAYTMVTDGTITVDTTPLTWTQFTGLGQILAGNGLTKTGNQIDVVGTADRISVAADAIDIATTYVGQTSITTLGTIATGTWNGTTIAVANGGTGATTAADARANLGATTKYSANVGGATTVAVTHNLGTKDVVVLVRENSTDAVVECDVTMTDTNTVTLGFAVAPAAGALRVTIVG
jgi:hypothetical protein